MTKLFALAFSAIMGWCPLAIAEEIDAYSPPSSYDQARNFVDELRFVTLEAMASSGLERSELERRPWSDSYWPYYQGLAAIRYADPDFPADEDWRVNASYLSRTLGRKPIWMLSPAEKYDLLVGDPKFTLTRTMLRLGRNLYRGPGTPAEWMGICHGWAAAAIFERRPRHSVLALAADGTTWIYFSPSDIKGLTSLLWARDRFPKRFIGLRCNSVDPPTDPSSRPVSPKCLDTNPATWHLTVVNQIGFSRKSLIMDAEWTAEVWNHPVVGYATRFFNPMTGIPVNGWLEATVLRSEFKTDVFRRNRSKSARFITGVEMDVTYMVEDYPRSDPLDDESLDKALTVTFRYDLELDASGVIIGGEWHTPLHPDFIWLPIPGVRASSVGDALIRASEGEKWSGKIPVPSNWRMPAIKASSFGQPLRAIVDRLIDLANE